MNWKDYQEAVAIALAGLGFVVSVEETVEGARGSHDIDVVARTIRANVEQLWIAECKYWKRRVPKERALTFIGIVGDVGADRGLMFSEVGFQAGAIRVARFTNVSLTSLADMKENTRDELAQLRLHDIDLRCQRLLRTMHSLGENRQTSARIRSTRIPNLGFDYIGLLGRVSYVASSVNEGKLGGSNLYLPSLNLDEEAGVRIFSLHEFVDKADEWLQMAETTVGSALKEFGSNLA